LCGCEYILITESGLKQIAEGYSIEKVLQWKEEHITQKPILAAQMDNKENYNEK